MNASLEVARNPCNQATERRRVTEKVPFQNQATQPIVSRSYRRSGVIVARLGGAFETFTRDNHQIGIFTSLADAERALADAVLATARPI
jgi:hypothetical protein